MTNTSKTDPRLLPADLTEDDFVGELADPVDIFTDRLLEAYRQDGTWAHRRPHRPLLIPKEGYALRFDFPSPTRDIFLEYRGELVGFFQNDSLVIDTAHQGKNLSFELILAGYPDCASSGSKPAIKIAC
jgi:hypothetical protein